MIPFKAASRRLAPLFAGVALAAMAALPVRAADAVLVKIENFAFTPQELTIKPGTTVTFENDDDAPHLVVATGGAFRSKALDTDDKFAFTFTKAGDFPYFCALHPHMLGKIKVQE